MKVFLPFNSKYFLNNYFDASLTSKIKKDVIPDIVERHSMSEYVEHIDIFSNDDFSELQSFSNKIRYIYNESYDGKSFVDLVDAYVKLSTNKDEPIVYHNPLFPFISMEKAFNAFKFVKANPNCIVNGKFVVPAEENRKLYVDLGALSVFTSKTLAEVQGRNTSCKEIIQLSTLEIMCLRTSDDWAHYTLIVNSGFKL